MAVFSYRGIDEKGKEVKGVVEASSYSAAHALLKKRGIYPYQIVEEEQKESFSFSLPFVRRLPNAQELAVFLRTLATLLEAGVPIVEAVESFTDEQVPRHLRLFYAKVASALKEGETLHSALKRAGVRDETVLSLVFSGERGALLPKNLSLAAEILEKRESLKNAVAQALIYPLILLVVAVGVVVFMMTTVIPKVVSIYSTAKLKLPFSTRLVVSVSHFFLNHYLLILFSLLLSLFLFYLFVKKRRKLYHRLLLKLPVFGELLYFVSLQRFFDTLGNLLKAGVPLVEAIEVSLGTVPNYYLRDKLSPLVEQVKRGSSFSETLSELVKLPSVLKQLIKSGELSGNLGEMLLRSANYLQLEVELKLKNLTTLVEPGTMLIVGITIGFIIYALLLPIVSISTIKAF